MNSIEQGFNTGELSSSNLEATSSGKGQSLWKRALWRVKSKLIYSKLTDNYCEMTVTLKKTRKSLIQVKESHSRGIIYPDSKLKLIWNCILVIMLIYTATVTPIRSCFIDPVPFDGWWWIDTLLDFLFLIDVIINLSSAYVNEDNTLESSRKKIFFRYLKTWLILDIFACFPMDLAQDESSRNSKRLIKLLRLFRLYRLFKIFRMLKQLNKGKSKDQLSLEEDQPNSPKGVPKKFEISPNALFLIQFSAKTLIAIHVISCLWFFSAKLNNFEPDTWVTFFGYSDYELPDLYLRSFYWAFTTLTTVGYGDIRPVNDTEILIAIIWMAFGICFFSYTLGVLSSLMLSQNSKEIALNKKLFAVDEFIKEENLSNKLKRDMKNALKYSNEKTGINWEDKQAIFNELPAELRYEVAIKMHSGVIASFPFFTQKDNVFIASVVPFLKNLFETEGEVIYSEGDFASDIFFVASGHVCLNHLLTSVKGYKPGKYFGDIEILYKVPRDLSAVCIKNSQLLSMSKDVVYFISEEFPFYASEMKITASINREKLRLKKRKLNHFFRLKKNSQIEGLSPEEIKKIIDGEIKAEDERASSIEALNSYGKASKVVRDLDLKIKETEQKLDLTRERVRKIKQKAFYNFN